MSQDPENFDALKKLLLVKRHEQPPPGYFDQLASEVMSRLQTGEHRQTDLWKELGDEASWVQRLLSMLNAKPALAGAFGVLVCGAVLTGLYFSQSGQVDTPMATAPSLIQKMDPPLALSQPEVKVADSTSSTNPVNSLNPFDKLGAGAGAQPVTVSFPAGGN